MIDMGTVTNTKIFNAFAACIFLVMLWMIIIAIASQITRNVPVDQERRLPRLGSMLLGINVFRVLFIELPIHSAPVKSMIVYLAKISTFIAFIAFIIGNVCILIISGVIE